MSVKAVTFDLWLTLIWDSKELEEYRKLRRLINFHRFANKVRNNSERKRHANLVSTARLGISEVKIAMDTMHLKLRKLHENGYDVRPDDRGKMLFDLIGLKFAPRIAEEIYSKAGEILSSSGYSSGFPYINPEAGPTMKLLKETFPDLKVALISNAARSAKTYERILKVLGVGKYFDHFVISCEVGYIKPRREIFEKALSLLSVKPPETLHIGDLFQADIVGATACGMNACLYTGLWDKYAQYKNPREHIPRTFRPPSKRTIVAEIPKLQDCVKVAQRIS